VVGCSIKRNTSIVWLPAQQSQELVADVFAGIHQYHLFVDRKYAFPQNIAVWSIHYRAILSAVKETVLPYSKSEMSETGSVRVPKDTILFVSIAGANRLESVWGPDAKQWKPERWFSDTLNESLDPSLRLPGIYANT